MTQLYRWLIQILGPPVRLLGYVVGLPFSPLIGWYNKRWAKRERARLEKEIQRQLSFLFSDHHAHVLQILELGALIDTEWPTVTVTVEGLLLRFMRCLGELQVYVTPEQRPNDWVELTLLLSVMDVSPVVRRRSDYRMSQVAEWLRPNLDSVNAAFSGGLNAELKERLERVHDFDQVATKQWQTEINRRLYPDK